MKRNYRVNFFFFFLSFSHKVNALLRARYKIAPQKYYRMPEVSVSVAAQYTGHVAQMARGHAATGIRSIGESIAVGHGNS